MKNKYKFFLYDALEIDLVILVLFRDTVYVKDTCNAYFEAFLVV